jgi:cell division septation protein DedD
MTPTYSPASLALSLVGDVRSLGLVSHLDGPLKNFTKRLLTCIRSIDDDVEVEEFRGHEFLGLISRLNQEVAPYLLQQELPFASTRSMHIWVIDQAHLLSTEQQSIIFRLIELFPGLPFRVIWLSNQPLQTWKNHAKTECIFLDLDAVDPGPIDLGEPTLVAEPTERPLSADTAALDTSASAALKWPGAGLSKNMKVGASALGLAILGGLAWMGASTSRPTAPEAAVAASEPTVPASSATASPAATEAASSPAAATPSAVAAAPENKSAKPTTASASKSKAKPAEATSKATANKALPEVAQTGGRWLKTLPADTFVVEHGSFGTLDQAQKLKGKHKELSNARIVAARKSPSADEWQFTVITGPFRSEDRAKSYVSRLDWKSSTRIRATDKLKPLLASAP